MNKIEIIASSICKENGIRYEALKTSTKKAIKKFGKSVLEEAFKEIFLEYPETQQDKLINFKILKILKEFTHENN